MDLQNRPGKLRRHTKKLIEHSRELLRLYRILCRQEPSGGARPLAVPRIITLFQKCTEYRISDALICRMHFNDLYVMIMSMDIASIKKALRLSRERAERQRGVRVRDVSPSDAVRFLKGGGELGG